MPRISKIPNRILEIIDISERNQQFKARQKIRFITVYTLQAQQESNLINAMKQVTT